MPWTETTRAHYRREGLRYTSNMTDAEWALLQCLLPRPSRLGRPRTTDLRGVVEAIFYILSSGCQWRALPREFPPYSTVQGYFYAWRDNGRWQRIVNVLVRRARRTLRRAAAPTAAVIDSQSARRLTPAAPADMMRASVFTAANGILPLTPTGFCSPLMSIPQTSRIATVPSRYWSSSETGFLDCSMSLRIGSIEAANSWMRLPTAVPGPSRSWSDRQASKASSSCPAGGSSNAPLHGSEDAAVCPRTSRDHRLPSSHGSSSPI